VKLKGRFLWVHLPDRTDATRIEKLLDQWYRAHAAPIFARRLDECLRSARSLNVDRPELAIRKPVMGWGRCTKDGRILLNTELVKTPLYCIEYVIMHELCHLRLHDHSPEFYRCSPAACLTGSSASGDWKRLWVDDRRTGGRTALQEERRCVMPANSFL
jgi:predicted metal-dependent hydrolase